MRREAFVPVEGSGSSESLKVINDRLGLDSQNDFQTETYGNSLIHAQVYNNRLQPTTIKLGTAALPTSVLNLTYNYGTTTNNGNVQSITYAGGGLSYTQTFGYDQLNRLTTSVESGASWSQTNSYDRYGNRSIVGGGLTFNATNNRITTAGYTYDAAGNLLNDTNHAYTFDAENKISKVDNVSAYVYDGESQRVRKLVGENTRFVYGLGGQVVAEFDGSTGNLKKEYVQGGATLITIEPTALNPNGTRYTTSDHLGSPRVVTSSSATVVSRHDYMPFGVELGVGVGGRTTGMGYGAADGLRQKFTRKERDNETGLDYFGARYYASTQGRFTSVDPLLLSAKLADPQSWNRYAYVGNNPLKFIDQLGLYRSPAFNCSEGNNACLNDEQRKVLNDSTIEVAGKKLSGEALYNALSEKQQNAFVNITDKLASIKLDDGSTALSQVSSVSGIKSDRILANVSNSLASSLESSNQFKSVPAGDHKPFDATSFKDTNSTFGNIQLSFNKSRRGADIDIDIGNVMSGDVAGPVVHLGEVIMNKISRTTTNQDSVRKILIRDPKIQTLTPSPDPKFNRNGK